MRASGWRLSSGILSTLGLRFLEDIMSRKLTAVIHREEAGFVALCPELDIASQGDTIEEARDNLREALELFFECAPAAEVEIRLGGTV